MEPTSQTESTEGLSKCTVSFGISLAVACIFNALLVVLKEKNPATMAWMKKTSGHHWATHTLLSLLVFIILGLILNKTNNGNSSKSDTKSLPSLIVSSVAIGAAIILGFYLFID